MFTRIRTAIFVGCPCRYLQKILFVLPALLLLCAAAAGAAVLPSPVPTAGQGTPADRTADMVPSYLNQPSLPLLPFLQVYIDVTGEMDVEEVAALTPEKYFGPLDVRHLPPVAGVTWLRFVLDAAEQGQENSAMLLDMGEGVPGTPTLFNPLFDTLSNTVEWRENTPTSRNILLLPRAGSEAQVCFLRLDGLPGLWFSPMLRTPHNAATDLSGLASRSALVALAVVMLLCLLRGLAEHGQWRIWTALYVAAALVQGYFGVPGNGAGHFSLEDAPALLTPGLALMFLPHVGRHLMRTRGHHRFLDVQFILLVLPGAVLALLPLVLPWTARYLPLWPLGCLLCVPTATAACLMGLPGARRFLLGILLPPAAVAMALMGLDFGYTPGILASLPLWGTALSALIIAATAVPQQEQEDEEDAPIELTMPAVEPGTLLLDDGPLTLGAPRRSERPPLPDDPNLRLLPSGDEGIALPRMDEEVPLREEAPAPEPSRSEARAGQPAAEYPDAERLEEALRRPLDDLMRETAVLEQCSLPPSARETARNMTSAARQMLAVLRDPASVLPGVSAPALQETFDLQELMRSVHDSVAAAAENGGIALAWYMPPHLPSFYSGEYRALDAVLRELLESAVRATRQGAVHFSVRRVPDSDDPGHLLFTVQDSGSGTPPAERSSLALSHVWELAGRSNGFFSAECGIRGATIAFTLHLEPVESTADAPSAAVPQASGRAMRRARILVCTPGAMDRQALVHMLDGLSCVVLQARTLPEALALHEQRPVTMLIASGSQVSVKAQDMLERFRQRAAAAHLPVFGAIAVTGDDSRWDELAKAGFTHALLEPVDRDALRRTVREILDAFFGSQAGESSLQTAVAAGRPAGFPPLAGLLPPESNVDAAVRDRSPREAAAETVVPEAEVPAETTPPATGAIGEERPHDEECEVHAPDSDDAAQPEAVVRRDETSSVVDGVTDAAPQQAETTVPAMPAEAGGAEELPVMDNQWGMSPAPAVGQVSHEAGQGGTAPAPQVQREESAPDETGESGENVLSEVAGQPVGEPLRTETEPSLPDVAADSGEAAASPGDAEAVPVAEPVQAAENAGERAAMQAADSIAPPASLMPESTPVPSDREQSGTASPSESSEAPAQVETAPAAREESPAAVVSAEAPAVSSMPESPVSPAEEITQAVPSPASGEFLEWVGEPTPIPSRRSEAEASRRPAAAPARPDDRPQSLTMREALKVVEQEQQSVERAAAGSAVRQSHVATEETSVGGSGEESSAGVPSFLKRVLGRLQGQGEGSGTPTGPQSGRARAAEARRRAAIKAAAARPSAGDAVASDTPVSVAAPTVGTAPAAPSAPSPAAPAAQEEQRSSAPAAAAIPDVRDTGADAADQEMLDLVARFDAAVRKAQQAFAVGNCLAVAVAAESIARDADAYGFRSLGRMARCVEQAGRHEDLGALRDLLPDLVSQVERNRIAIQKELR